jgi:hypothetical protein
MVYFFAAVTIFTDIVAVPGIAGISIAVNGGSPEGEQ